MAFRLRHPATVFAHDLTMVPLAWLGAYWLRFNLGYVPAEYLDRAVALLPFVTLVQAAVFWWFGMYRGVWRFASLPDLVRILKAVALGAVAGFGVLFLLTRLEGVPRSIPLLYGMLLIILLSGPRFLYRWLKDHHFDLRDARRVLIVGAGQAGEMLVRDLLRNPAHAYQPIAFVDDDRRAWGKEIHGIRVLPGGCDRIPAVVSEREIDIVILAVPTANNAQMRRLVEFCEQSGVPFQTIPRLEHLMSGQVSINEMREVAIEDLLGREPVRLDWQRIRRGVTGRTVMITGAGGSIGAELCRQVARLGPGRLVLFEISEFNLFSIENELRSKFPDLAFEGRLGDVCDASAVRHAMAAFQPHLVLHAAAYKHVPMLESQARQAARNNVLGTRNVALAATDQGCETFVLISTDKAVNPTNIMGASKRAAELFCQNHDRDSATRFITVRFGNVLGSAGSVVPLFREQIARGGPVTVTHPDMQRYFMTIPEASQLILQAAVIGRGGEIFVLDMGLPVKIEYLAEQMILLSGKRPGRDVEIVYSGLRPGEKLFEELFHEDEALSQTDHDKILLARYRRMDMAILDRLLGELEGACDGFDEVGVVKLLQVLVPEYREQPPGVQPPLAARSPAAAQPRERG